MLRGKLPPEQFLIIQGNHELNKFSNLPQSGQHINRRKQKQC
jgi:hypothetical protein